MKRPVVLLALVLGMLALAPGAAFAQSSSFVIEDEAIQTFYDAHDGAATLGAPISRVFEFMGAPTQLFEQGGLQVQADGAITVVPLGSLLSTTNVGGLTVPATDGALAMLAPTPEQTNYSARLTEFLRATVNEPFSVDLEVWGLPTSLPKSDPNNPRFVYQRFQNGILMYNADTGTVSAVPLGSYFKDVLGATSDAFAPNG